MTDKLSYPVDQTSMIQPPLGHNVLNECNVMFEAAVEKAAKLHGGEKIGWGLSLMALPTEQRDPQTGAQQLVMVLVCYLSIPGAQLGTAITSTSMGQLEGRTQEMTDQEVYDLVAGALDARSKQLDQQAIDEAQAASHGGTVPTSGLISTNGQPLRANDSDLDQRVMDGYVQGTTE